LRATEDDDDGAIQDADENRTSRAVLIVTVAPWSSWRRGQAGRCGQCRRHGDAGMRAREYPAGA